MSTEYVLATDADLVALPWRDKVNLLRGLENQHLRVRDQTYWCMMIGCHLTFVAVALLACAPMDVWHFRLPMAFCEGVAAGLTFEACRLFRRGNRMLDSIRRLGRVLDYELDVSRAMLGRPTK